MSEYPILVRHYTGDQALTIVCAKCHTEEVIDPDEILNDDLYECPADTEKGRRASTEPRCRGYAQMKYFEADPCPNCQKLGFWERDVLSGCCSRVCQLQLEYAAELAARKATA